MVPVHFCFYFRRCILKGEFSGYSCTATAWVHRSKPWCSKLRHSTCTHNAVRSSVTQGWCHKSSLATALYEGVGDRFICYLNIHCLVGTGLHAGLFQTIVVKVILFLNSEGLSPFGGHEGGREGWMREWVKGEGWRWRGAPLHSFNLYALQSHLPR